VDGVNDALRRSHDSALVVDTAYRALIGRSASPEEQAMVRQRAVQGLEFADLVTELAASDAGADVAMARSLPAIRSVLRRHFANGDPPAAERLVFLHIMRAGGTSVSELLQGAVGADRSRVHLFLDDLVLTASPILAHSCVLAGHIPFAGLALIPPPYSTVCILRDPLARPLSHFSPLQTVRDEYRHLSLDEFVFSDRFDVPSGNYQARQLAHDGTS
jgi:hypothetical protein